jgi:hypothetical protein
MRMFRGNWVAGAVSKHSYIPEYIGNKNEKQLESGACESKTSLRESDYTEPVLSEESCDSFQLDEFCQYSDLASNGEYVYTNMEECKEDDPEPEPALVVDETEEQQTVSHGYPGGVDAFDVGFYFVGRIKSSVKSLICTKKVLCEGCGKDYHQKSINRHKKLCLENLHEQRKELECGLCGLTMNSKNVKKHLEVCNKNRKQLKRFICGDCGQSFTTNYNLQGHIENKKDPINMLDLVKPEDREIIPNLFPGLEMLRNMIIKPEFPTILVNYKPDMGFEITLSRMLSMKSMIFILDGNCLKAYENIQYALDRYFNPRCASRSHLKKQSWPNNAVLVIKNMEMLKNTQRNEVIKLSMNGKVKIILGRLKNKR